MRSVVMVDPFRCRMWHLHDRLEEYISEESCRTEIESFNKHGQLIPALGRRLTRDDHYEVELICGARRLFIAKYTRKPLRVEICDLSDKEAIVAIDMENRQRQDVSPYERGLSYARWLRAGYFESQDELAQALNVSASQVSRLLKLARLPAVIVDAFANTVEICENWGLSLTDLLEDPVSRRCILKKAREIAGASPRPAAREVYRRLLAAAAPGMKPKLLTRDEVIKSDIGEPLFRVRRQRDSIVLILPLEKIGSKALDSIKHSVANILQPPMPTRRSPLPDHPRRVSLQDASL